MIETYKILSEKENISSEQFFGMPDNIYSLRGHNKKIKKNCVRLDIRKYFYSQRVVKHWNRLSQKVVDATSVNGFKNALDKEWGRHGRQKLPRLTSPLSYKYKYK